MLIKGSLTPGTFQAFFQYMNMSSEPITELSYMTNSLQSALASMERVYELLDEPEMEAEPEAPKRIGHALGAVEFSHVRFGQLLVNRHFVSFIHSFFMMFQALDPRQKVMSHHLILQPFLYFFNCHLIYFCYFFHCFRYPRLLSGSISQKFCQFITNLI